MFREMRRSRQAMTGAEIDQILVGGTSGVLAVSGDDGYPYAVPLSYVYSEGRIYFHCAREGHKLDGIRRSDKVSFCVIDRDEIHPENLTTYFQSVVVFGRAVIIDNGGEKKDALMALAEKYAPGRRAEGEKAVAQDWEKTCVVKIEIEHASGKKAIELVS